MKTIRPLFYSFMAASLLLMNISVFAAALSPVGTWTTIDDKTGKARSVVKLWVSNGVLYGKILSVYKRPGDTGYCHNCPGRFKGKPVKGLVFLWGLRNRGNGQWGGGKVLDPKIGRIYDCKITVTRNGKALKVRGYVGLSLLGRTQTWVRR